MQQYPYISYLTKDQIENFIKTRITKVLGYDTPIMICNWKYFPSTKINFFVEVETNKGKHTTLGLAIVEDFRCDIAIKGKHNTFAKEWAQYICDCLDENIKTSSDKISSKEYKKQYNTHCQMIRNATILKAEKDCEEKLIK